MFDADGYMTVENGKSVHQDDVVLVPHVIRAVDEASLTNQVGLFLLSKAKNSSDGKTTYLIAPNGEFVAILPMYQKVSQVLKGDING